MTTLEVLQNNDDVVLLWEEGKKIKLKTAVTMKDMQLKIGGKTDWFSITGGLKLDEENVLPIEALLELMEMSSGRFLKMDNGEYIARTAQLYQRLQQLQGVGHQKGKGINFHPFARQAIEELTDGMSLKNSVRWKNSWPS